MQSLIDICNGARPPGPSSRASAKGATPRLCEPPRPLRLCGEMLRREDPQIAQAFTQALVPAAEKLEKLQVKIEGDNDKACGCHKEQVGMILVPQKDIQPENDAVNSELNKRVG